MSRAAAALGVTQRWLRRAAARQALPLGTYSQGRTLGLLAPELGPLGCRRLLVHVAAAARGRWQEHFAQLGFVIGPPLRALEGARKAVTRACADTVARSTWPAGWTCRRLGAADLARLAPQLHGLQAEVGLTPLPTWFLCDAASGVCTTAAFADARLVAAVTVHRVRRARAQGGMIAALAVAPAARRRGVARSLLATALVDLFADPAVTRVDAVCAATASTIPTLARACGMRVRRTAAVFFAEHAPERRPTRSP